MADIEEVLLYLTPKSTAQLAQSEARIGQTIIRVEARGSYWQRRLELYYPNYLVAPANLKVNPRLIYDVLQMLRGMYFFSYFTAMVEMSEYYTDTALVRYVAYLKLLFPKPNDLIIDILASILHRAKVVVAIHQAYPELVKWKLLVPNLIKGQYLETIDALIPLVPTLWERIYTKLGIDDAVVFNWLVTNHLPLLFSKNKTEKVALKKVIGRALSVSNDTWPSIQYILTQHPQYASNIIKDWIVPYNITIFKNLPPFFRDQLIVNTKLLQEYIHSVEIVAVIFPLRDDPSKDSELMWYAVESNADKTIAYLFQQGVIMYPGNVVSAAAYVDQKFKNSLNTLMVLLTKDGTAKDISFIKEYVRQYKPSAATEATMIAAIADAALAVEYYNDFIQRGNNTAIYETILIRSLVPDIVRSVLEITDTISTLTPRWTDNPDLIPIMLELMPDLKMPLLEEMLLDMVLVNNIKIATVLIKDGRVNPFEGEFKETAIVGASPEMIEALLKSEYEVTNDNASEIYTAIIDEFTFEGYLLGSAVSKNGDIIAALEPLLNDERFKMYVYYLVDRIVLSQLFIVLEWLLQSYAIPYAREEGGNSIDVAVTAKPRSYLLTQILLLHGTKPRLAKLAVTELPPALQELLE